MADERQANQTTPEYGQLTQARVPLEDAADAFATRDASGRIPIVLIPRHLNRIRNDVVLAAVVVLIGGISLGVILDNGAAIISLAILVGVILAVLGVYRSFIVRIPEGVNGLLTKGGRYIRTVGAGTHFVPPWIPVSHLVTRRDIPFDVPVVEAPTKDNVRANLDILLTFQISEPYLFVFNISADDFDQVFQAACQDALRIMLRRVKSTEITDLTDEQMGELLQKLGKEISSYGVEITKISTTFAQPPPEFIQLKESLQLVALQKAEQKEKQELVLRQQSDSEILARQKVIARVERQREELQSRFQSSEARRKVVELEAEAEELRLEKLDERLKKYPTAAEYELELRRLDIARALAGNTRAMLQVGSADDIARAFILRDIMSDSPVDVSDGNPPSDEDSDQAQTKRTDTK